MLPPTHWSQGHRQWMIMWEWCESDIWSAWQTGVSVNISRPLVNGQGWNASHWSHYTICITGGGGGQWTCEKVNRWAPVMMHIHIYKYMDVAKIGGQEGRTELNHYCIHWLGKIKTHNIIMSYHVTMYRTQIRSCIWHVMTMADDDTRVFMTNGSHGNTDRSEW